MAINLGSAYGKIEIDASGVVKGVRSAVDSMETLKTKAAAVGQAMQQVGGIMTAALTVPLALAGRKALDTFAEYEKAMNILGSVSGATADEMEQLSKLAKELGADLTLPGTSAADAAQAMAELAKAGLDVNEIMAATKGVLQMSAAGQLSNAEAAEITANALNAFKLAGGEAVRVADLLAAGANSSSAEVREMADSLKMSSAVFATAGMKVEDLVTAIALMANSGIQGSDAGTSLKTMLLSLQAPSKDARAAMHALGISVYDASGNMLSMPGIINEFSDAMEGLTQKQRNAALAAIFGSDSIRAANIVLLGGIDAYDQMYQKVNQVGAAADLASAMMQGLTGAMENVKSAFETASIAAIEPFKEDLASLLGFVAKALNAFAELPAPIRKFIVVALALLAVMGPILVIFGTLLSTVASVITAFGTLGISLAGVGAAITAGATALGGFAAAAGAVLLPILLLIGGIALLYWAFKTNFMNINVIWEQFWFIIKYYSSEGWKWLINAVQQGGKNVADWFSNMTKKIMALFKAINWSDIGKYIIQGIIAGLTMNIAGLIATVLKISSAVKKAFDKDLDINSPSGWFKTRGVYSMQGYMQGLGTMKPADISRALSAPITNSSVSNQVSTNNTIHMASGLTLRDVDQLVNRRIEDFTIRLNRALPSTV